MQNDILNIYKYRSVAIMGGTFDPIHYGHLVAAEAVRHELGIEKVIFIPTGSPPHKDNSEVSHSEHRYLMTVLATAQNPYFDVSRIEIERLGLTYTIDTIRTLRGLCSDETEIYFITGADAVHEILGWKDSKTLLGLCNFVAVTRPGYKKDKLSNKIAELETKFEKKLFFLEIPALSISSSDIRNRVKNQLPIKYLLPTAVEQYIFKNGLYSHETDALTDMNSYVHSLLSEKRYRHTMGVVDEAAKLAAFYGADEKKARIAALLHDIAKEYSDETKRKLCREYKIKLDDIIKKQVDLSHGLLGAEIARKRFNIKDEEILNAIRYHTTGRPGMTLLEKIIFIADCIEPYRGVYPELDKIRNLAYTDLDAAIKTSITGTILFNKNKNRLIHPLSTSALRKLDRVKQEEE